MSLNMPFFLHHSFSNRIFRSIPPITRVLKKNLSVSFIRAVKVQNWMDSMPAFFGQQVKINVARTFHYLGLFNQQPTEDLMA